MVLWLRWLLLLPALAVGSAASHAGDGEIFWTEPSELAWTLSQPYQDSLILSPVLTGEVQYRLDIACSADSLLAHFETAWDGYVFNEFLLRLTPAAGRSFRMESLSFGDSTLQQALAQFPVIDAQAIQYRYVAIQVKLDTTVHYNMPQIADEFEELDGVLMAEAVRLSHVPETPVVALTIEEEVYKFTFYPRSRPWVEAIEGQLEVWVVDDRIVRQELHPFVDEAEFND